MFNKSFIVCIIIIILIICIYHIVNNVNCGCINGFSVGGKTDCNAYLSIRSCPGPPDCQWDSNMNRCKSVSAPSPPTPAPSPPTPAPSPPTPAPSPTPTQCTVKGKNINIGPCSTDICNKQQCNLSIHKYWSPNLPSGDCSLTCKDLIFVNNPSQTCDLSSCESSPGPSPSSDCSKIYKPTKTCSNIGCSELGWTNFSYNKGYIEVKNISKYDCIVWLDGSDPVDKNVKYTSPPINLKNITDTQNIMIYNNTNVKQILNNRLKGTNKNGILLNQNETLFFKLNGLQTRITSFGFWITKTNVTNSIHTPKTNKFEISVLPGWCDSGTNCNIHNKQRTDVTLINMDLSFVDGYNSLMNVYYNILDKSNGYTLLNDECGKEYKCNINLQNCEAKSGKIITSNNNSDSKGGMKICQNPKFQDDIKNIIQKMPYYKDLKSNLQKENPTKEIEIDPLGCNETSVDEKIIGITDSGVCNCIEAWYANPTNTERYISPKLKDWWNNIHDTCPTSYAWAYHEDEPIDINNNIFDNPKWCQNIATKNNISPSDNIHTMEKLESSNIFKKSLALATPHILLNTIPRIFVTIEDIL